MVKGRQFDRSVILLCVRWYLAYGLSLRDLEEMMAERGIAVDHATIHRWLIRYSPELLQRRPGRRAAYYGYSPLLRQHRRDARVAFLHRPPVPFAATYALKIGEDGRIGRKRKGHKQTHGRKRKDHHDIRRSKVLSREVRNSAQTFIHVSERALEPALCGHKDRVVRRQVEGAQIETARHGQLKRAVGEMKPVKVVGKRRLVRSNGELPGPIFR